MGFHHEQKTSRSLKKLPNLSVQLSKSFSPPFCVKLIVHARRWTQRITWWPWTAPILCWAPTCQGHWRIWRLENREDLGGGNTEKWGHQDLAKFLDFYIYGYGSIPIDTFLVGWTSIYQLFWCSPGVQGFDTLPYIYIYQQSTKKTQMHQSYIHIHIYLPIYWLILTMILALDMASRGLLHLWPQP